MRPFLAVISLLALVQVAVAKPPQNEQERVAALQRLIWRDGQTLTLPLSGGALRAPANIRLVGSDAATVLEATNGVDAPAGIEAMLYDPASHGSASLSAPAPSVPSAPASQQLVIPLGSEFLTRAAPGAAGGLHSDAPLPGSAQRRLVTAREQQPPRRGPSLKPTDDETRRKLIRSLQRELKRVGCYDWEVHGYWGSRSKRAMTAFIDRVNATLPIEEPDYILLSLLQGHTGQACGKPCPAGQAFDDAGRCRPQALLARSAPSRSRFPTAAVLASPWSTSARKRSGPSDAESISAAAPALSSTDYTSAQAAPTCACFVAR